MAGGEGTRCPLPRGQAKIRAGTSWEMRDGWHLASLLPTTPSRSRASSVSQPFGTRNQHTHSKFIPRRRVMGGESDEDTNVGVWCDRVGPVKTRVVGTNVTRVEGLYLYCEKQRQPLPRIIINS